MIKYRGGDLHRRGSFAAYSNLLTNTPHWCGGVLDPDAVFAELVPDPVTGREVVLTACSREHLQALRHGAAGDVD